MTIVDGVFARSDQTRHLLNVHAPILNRDPISIDHNVDAVSNQPTVDRVRVSLHLDRTANADLDVTNGRLEWNLARRKLAELRLLFHKPFGSV